MAMSARYYSRLPGALPRRWREARAPGGEGQREYSSATRAKADDLYGDCAARAASTAFPDDGDDGHIRCSSAVAAEARRRVDDERAGRRRGRRRRRQEARPGSGLAALDCWRPFESPTWVRMASRWWIERRERVDVEPSRSDQKKGDKNK
jgi:hypothetical protein